MNAEVVLNSSSLLVNFVIDGVTTRVSPLALGFGSNQNRYGILTSPVHTSYDVDLPSAGPLYTVNYDVTSDPIPFQQDVRVYLTSATNTLVIGSEVNLCLITDPVAFVASYQSVTGTSVSRTVNVLGGPSVLGGR